MPSPPHAVERRLIVSLASLCAASIGACVFLGWRLAAGTSGGVSDQELLRDPEIQREVIRRLAEDSKMPLDSHPDPDVGRVLIPSSQRGDFQTNDFGMRERPIEIDKPPGVVRVVLLGDSFVFGLNIDTADRMGALLERHLTERAAEPKPRFECLHYGLNSWNILAECAFLRRHVERLAPDLVVQITVSNDLDDVTGVRGFGTESTFAPRHRERADSLVLDRYSSSFLGASTRNYLSRGLDHESRTRFAGALGALRQLRALMHELPGDPRHLLLVHWGPLSPAFHRNLGRELEPESLAYVPVEFSTDKSVWLTPNDPHWNEQGHARVAELLYGLIRTKELLPLVELAAWPEAEELARSWEASGREYATTGWEHVRETFPEPVAAIELPGWSKEEAGQVHGGIDLEGLVSPYASFVLHREPAARTLRIRGRALPELALRGSDVRVFLEELELSTFELEPGQPIDLELPIPAALDGREFLDVRFAGADYVYRGDDLRHCVVFQLERAALD